VNEIIIEDTIMNSMNGSIEQTGSIFVYSKNNNSIINPMYKSKFRDPYWHTMHSKGQGGSKIFRLDGQEYEIDPPVGRHWTFSQDTIDIMCQEGKIKLNTKGKPVYLIGGKPYILDNNWLDVPGFQLQNDYIVINDQIIERLIGTFSNDSDKILQIYVRNEKSIQKSILANRKNTFLSSIRRESHKIKTMLEKNNIAFNYYTSGIIEKGEYDIYNQVNYILNIIGAQITTNFNQFHGILDNHLICIFPFSQTFDWNDLKVCSDEFIEMQNMFNGFSIIAEEFQEDEMWNQIIDELKDNHISVKYFRYTEFFNFNNIRVKILQKPVAEINYKIDGDKAIVEISDCFFLNEESVPSELKSNFSQVSNFSDLIQYWEINSLDNEGNIVSEYLIERENKKNEIKTKYSFSIKDNENYLVIRIFDLTGAFTETKIVIGGD